jgi:hypothetical protein
MFNQPTSCSTRRKATNMQREEAGTLANNEK